MHCHLNMLDLTSFDGDDSSMINNMLTQGINRIVYILVKLEILPGVKSFANRYESVFTFFGVCPLSTNVGPNVAK